MEELTSDNTLSNKPGAGKKTVIIPKDTSFNNSIIAPTDNLKKVLETQQLLRLLVATDIIFSKPILEQSGNAVIFPHTINVIQGQAGVHKSRVAENICSAMLKRHDCKNELLGFKRVNFDANYTVVYVDTERNLSEQLPFALQSIQIKAGCNKEDILPNFQYISLLQVKRKDRFDTLNEYLNHLRLTNTEPLFIVLDVSTDCIEDFNKSDKSMELIDLMNVAVNDHKAVFLCLIHENPKSDKARGHFGTELLNKASTAMQVGFEKDDKQNDTELIRAKYLKCRSTAKHAPFYFKYCTNEKGLVLASDSDVSTAVNNRKQKAGIEDIIEHVEMYIGDGSSIYRNDLLDKLCKDFKASVRTMESRLNEIRETKAGLTDNEGRFCNLRKETKEKQVIYSLIQAESQ